MVSFTTSPVYLVWPAHRGRSSSGVQRTDISLHDERQVSTAAVDRPPKLTGGTQSDAAVQLGPAAGGNAAGAVVRGQLAD
jgi:hypothetical protein